MEVINLPLRAPDTDCLRSIDSTGGQRPSNACRRHRSAFTANVKWSVAPPLLFERPIGYLAGAGHLTVGGNHEGIALRLMVKRRPRGTLTSEKQSSAGDQTAAHANNLVQSANNLIFFHS
ncbi:2-dioxygenase,Hydroxyquinol 1 [Trichinella spiralis]|uniref:2-dioxygenase,Hydroxyquinol 1 n=2 Tax=Trichinella spiralis TaxID=6334 RepID=A0ABR3KB37_TRISP|nr:hypothetical protein T01_412 [Trichinella spiralis]